MTTVVHVTHEAVHKVGGIGAVLAGLITAPSYRRSVTRTLLVGPLLDRHHPQALGADGTVLYDNWNGVWSEEAGGALYGVEVRRGVRIVYGRRPFPCADGDTVEAEVVLVDVEGSVPNGLGAFKHRLYQAFGLASDRYEGHWEYEQYLRLAEPAYDAITALLGDGERPCHIVAHEFMGLPTALKAQLQADAGVFTLFYAHEVATARRLVEGSPGGDVRFYQALRSAAAEGLFVDDLFGPQDDFFKHALVSQAWRCDAVLAVGDLVVDELRFLSRDFASCRIDRVYNGVPSPPALTPADRADARRRLARLVEGLLGWTPDLVFTHVGRLVASKALWRDLQVLEGLESALPEAAGSAALIVLATESGPRLPVSVATMRDEYGWPLVHREGYPDLTPGELDFDLRVRAFNARSRRGKVLFVNQFGFDAESTGGAVPESTGFSDLRHGSDAEFGLSTYEPFGIAQIEALAFGGLSVISDACGCAGFLRQVTPVGGPAVHVCGAYTQATSVPDSAAPAGGPIAAARHAVDEGERVRSVEVAAELAAALPVEASQRQRLLRAGFAAASKMSWDGVVEGQLLPVLRRIEAQPRP